MLPASVDLLHFRMWYGTIGSWNFVEPSHCVAVMVV